MNNTEEILIKINELLELLKENNISNSNNEFLTSEEVIKLLRLNSKSTLNMLCHEKRIPYYKPAKQRLFIKSEILEWIKKSGFKARSKRKLNNDM